MAESGEGLWMSTKERDWIKIPNGELPVTRTK
jgi:hypothetical protein